MPDTVSLERSCAKTALAAVEWVMRMNDLMSAADRARCEAAAAELGRALAAEPERSEAVP